MTQALQLLTVVARHVNVRLSVVSRNFAAQVRRCHPERSEGSMHYKNQIHRSFPA